MPQGACKPIPEDQLEYVLTVQKAAREYGLEYEWMRYFIGGLLQGFSPQKAADEAAFEWDF